MRGGRGGPCGLCEQDYHGVVSCALVGVLEDVGRPERTRSDECDRQLGNGLAQQVTTRTHCP